MVDKNFLLGKGEKLTANVDIISGGGTKNPPYKFSKAKERVSSRLKKVRKAFVRLSPAACPEDHAVATITVHPRYTTKSDFPTDLISKVGLVIVGSKSVVVTPEEWGTKRHPDKATTIQFYVAGRRSAFVDWSEDLDQWDKGDTASKQLSSVEDLLPLRVEEKLRPLSSKKGELLLEVVLHTRHDFVLAAFNEFAAELGGRADLKRLRSIGGLTFLPLTIDADRAPELAQFSFIRVIRGMPQIRPLRPQVLRSTSGQNCILPGNSPLSSDVRVLVFDGGLPSQPDLSKWATAIDAPGIGPALPEFQEHGLAVTSAILFGPLENGLAASVPFAHVDHCRVLDQNSGNPKDPNLYDVLTRIRNFLDQNKNKYQFINISLGPDQPYEDDDVSLWTSDLDTRFSASDTLVTAAVGNTGHMTTGGRLHLIQPPSDGVNMLSIGACDVQANNWKVSDYSSRGPGRCPGLIKPDGVAFGGSLAEPFHVLGISSSPTMIGLQGTSFASPFVLRAGVGVRVSLGPSMPALAIKALHIHRIEDSAHSRANVGWGRFKTNVEDLLVCPDDEVTVVYSKTLPVKEHLRAQVPLPREPLTGEITISATLCISSEIDPDHAFSYTRSGMEVIFRPSSKIFRKYKNGKTSTQPKSLEFFTPKAMYRGEVPIRTDGHKWETCLHATHTLDAEDIFEAAFDIYHHHRSEGRAPKTQNPLPYALVISVKAPEIPDFYNRVVRAYSGVLEALVPIIRIPVRSRL